MSNTKAFWEQQTSSMHRSDDPEFYRRKAGEHAALLTAAERAAGCIDLGCGAGELLKFFAEDVRVEVGLDFSDSMLAAARTVLARHNIDFTSANVFEYLPRTRIPVWVTTGALNQYMRSDELIRLLKIFANNREARSFFLFDCIDPIRYALLPLGMSYLSKHAQYRKLQLSREGLVRLYCRVRYGIAISLGLMEREVRWLGKPSLGYAIAPRFWHKVCERTSMSAEIVSSRYYEYRYHVIVRKSEAESG